MKSKAIDRVSSVGKCLPVVQRLVQSIPSPAIIMFVWQGLCVPLYTFLCWGSIIECVRLEVFFEPWDLVWLCLTCPLMIGRFLSDHFILWSYWQVVREHRDFITCSQHGWDCELFASCSHGVDLTLTKPVCFIARVIHLDNCSVLELTIWK